ncbi:predicted protein [Naegleria gruberi]|uniref:Predicted protein n=1 Tax=Naegleria gruberi TaxID=5762 RepID=D2W1I6_NAEGR|nr:uncharacterized protein NAEGRDRAFT_75234 [Naegleria gruberi]EFC37052.1 predicted protein [Naegleria gruberi]|eukprot:XP_002669796.1 predicted protein [Naegleria gruberi strain NEG-M]
MSNSNLLSEFKTKVIVDKIAHIFLVGPPPHSRSWGFPAILLMNEQIMASILKDSYEPYSKMNNQEKKEARDWYETCGAIVNKMIGMIDWEDWDGHSAVECDVLSFEIDHPHLYQLVVDDMIKKAFSSQSEEEREVVKSTVFSDPPTFAYYLSQNLPTLIVKHVPTN